MQGNGPVGATGPSGGPIGATGPSNGPVGATVAGPAGAGALAGPAPAGAAAHDASSLSVIAEFKRRSPSAGWLQAGADAVSLCRGYVAAGARALSVADFQLVTSYFEPPLEAGLNIERHAQF